MLYLCKIFIFKRQLIPPADNGVKRYWFGVEVKFINLDIDEIENKDPADPSIIP